MKKYRIKKAIMAVICLAIFSSNTEAKHALPEKYYQEAWCREHMGKTEHVLPDGTRVDCLTEDYAVEFDFAQKWAESIGQSLYYASKTARKPGIVLIIEKKTDMKYYYKIQKLCDDYDIKLWYVRKQKDAQEYNPEGFTIQNIIDFILNLFNEICKLFK